MPLLNSYREVKLENGERVNQIKNLTQKEWMIVCERLGLHVVAASGKGSHCAVYKSSTCSPTDVSCCVVTIPCKVFPNFQRDLVKKIIFYGINSDLYTEEDFWNAVR